MKGILHLRLEEDCLHFHCMQFYLEHFLVCRWKTWRHYLPCEISLMLLRNTTNDTFGIKHIQNHMGWREKLNKRKFLLKIIIYTYIFLIWEDVSVYLEFYNLPNL